jgi:hypothetical protein
VEISVVHKLLNIGFALKNTYFLLKNLLINLIKILFRLDFTMSENNKVKEPKFEIIGQDHQILQILLYPSEAISINNGTVIYSSPNIKQKIKNQGMSDFFK